MLFDGRVVGFGRCITEYIYKCKPLDFFVMNISYCATTFQIHVHAVH